MEVCVFHFLIFYLLFTKIFCSSHLTQQPARVKQQQNMIIQERFSIQIFHTLS